LFKALLFGITFENATDIFVSVDSCVNALSNIK
jgi:hypothetical protein